MVSICGSSKQTMPRGQTWTLILKMYTWGESKKYLYSNEHLTLKSWTDKGWKSHALYPVGSPSFLTFQEITFSVPFRCRTSLVAFILTADAVVLECIILKCHSTLILNIVFCPCWYKWFGQNIGNGFLMQLNSTTKMTYNHS